MVYIANMLEIDLSFIYKKTIMTKSYVNHANKVYVLIYQNLNIIKEVKNSID